jgi:hypothetical protein
LWEVALQEVAVRLGMPIHVCHFAPGTNKGNKIEQRRFFHITQNWRRRPLVSHDVMINVIANTDAELTELNLKLADVHGDWNDTLLPRRKTT